MKLSLVLGSVSQGLNDYGAGTDVRWVVTTDGRSRPRHARFSRPTDHSCRFKNTRTLLCDYLSLAPNSVLHKNTNIFHMVLIYTEFSRNASSV